LPWVILILTASVLVGTALYSILQQERFIRDFTADMRDLLEEAELVKKDLEAVMENAVMLSRDLAQSLKNQMQQVGTANHAGTGVCAGVHSGEVRRQGTSLPFSIEDLRKAHPYLVVPRLKEQGWSVQEIAEILGRGLGEIQLILDLHSRKEACS